MAEDKRYDVSVREGKDYITVGKISIKDGKVTLNFKEASYEDFFSEVGLGTKGYAPKDGQEYIDAVLAAFSMSSTIVISEG